MTKFDAQSMVAWNKRMLGYRGRGVYAGLDAGSGQKAA